MAKKSLRYKVRDHEFCIRENSWIAMLAARKLKSSQVAVTIGKTIHLWHTSSGEFLTNISWVNHELCHVQQFKRYGYLKFITMYLYESIRNGYTKNKFEIEAREAEKFSE
ncbi:MAG: DUF4157 domain-containing protein [Chitinophagaceae bacterium]|nr:DUF4157 domain-containing protein [Chitinophagaceae bacterium]